MIAKAMVDQETGQRGFLITGKEEFLKPYETGKKNLKKSIGELRALVAKAHDRPGTSVDLDDLERLAREMENSGRRERDRVAATG